MAGASEDPVVVDPSFGPAPEFLRRYDESEVLGEGGMGTVASCLDRQIGRHVALKRLRSQEGENARRFVREARIQGQLEHPSVPPVYELDVDPDGAPFFTMKRVRGVTLKEALRRLKWYPERYGESYSLRRLLGAFGRVCLAVDYAHRRGVLHRDLKPANIMLGDYGEVTVIDWGIARLVGDVESDTVLCTPGYASPEQIAGRELSPASDVYALGAILFEILTLERLHPADANAAEDATLAGQLDAPSARKPDADPELDAICLRALALEPADRFSSARELYEAVESHLDGQRDAERRRALADEHAQHAMTQIRSELTLDARKTALGEIGRALTLDPGNAVALEALAALTAAPLGGLPPEVEDSLARTRHEQTRWAANVAGASYLTLFLYLPLFFWAGILNGAALVVFYVLVVGAAAITLAVGRAQRPHVGAVLLAMLLSNAAFATTTVLFGPLVLMPGLVAVNTTAYALLLDKPWRTVTIVGGIAFVLVPALVEAFGIAGTPHYAFGPQGMTVASGAIALTRAPALVLLLVGSVATVITGAFATSRMRDALGQAELRLALSAWHLRELGPRIHPPH
ncbi:MAG: serine/threonine protein kinase [Polyangiaceae bacterium]|nr:serine/threonine protein kinase [Polyangiaceae bacterium]